MPVHTARLTLQNGTFAVANNSTFTIGAASGATGTLALATGGALVGSARIIVGATSSNGSLTLGLGGGTVTANLLDLGSGVGGCGSALVSGPFSSVTTGSLIVGNAGVGVMVLDTSTIYQNNGAATVGNLAGSSGVVTVDTTSRWIQGGTLLIGNAGAGTVNVLNGASLNGAVAILGSSTSGFGRLKIAGSSLRKERHQ